MISRRLWKYEVLGKVYKPVQEGSETGKETEQGYAERQEDLKSEQRTLTEPLLHHYFNGCYSQMDYNVPQLYRIIAQVVATLLLIIAVIFTIVRIVKKPAVMKIKRQNVN